MLKCNDFQFTRGPFSFPENEKRKTEIRSLRNENKKLRMKLTNLQKRLTNGRGDQHELATFQKESLRVRTEYDALKVVTTKHRKEINKLRGEAKMFELEGKANGGYGPMGTQIRVLEKK